MIGSEAGRYKLKMYLMTKHFNRNPLVSAAALGYGFEGVVAVDHYGASINWSYNIPVRNIGHLCQVPIRSIPQVLKHRPEVITVYSLVQASHISRAAEDMGMVQDILLRIAGPGDTFFYGQEGGILIGDLMVETEKILKLKGVTIVGVTSFPCLTYAVKHDEKVEETNNLSTILEAADLLETCFGIRIRQINAPGNNHIEVFEMLAKRGITHIEPGQALLGTTLQHAFHEISGEPCYLYISEVTHIYDDNAYALGGGLWQGVEMENNLEKALVGSDKDAIMENVLNIEKKGQGQVIDYHIILNSGERSRIGDSVICCSYVQMQQTNSCIAIVDGIQNGKSKLLAIFDRGVRPVTKDYMPLPYSDVQDMVKNFLYI